MICTSDGADASLEARRPFAADSLCTLIGIDLDRKLVALRPIATQPAGLVAMLDEQAYVDQIAEEASVAARSVRAREPEDVLGHVVQDHLL